MQKREVNSLRTTDALVKWFTECHRSPGSLTAVRILGPHPGVLTSETLEAAQQSRGSGANSSWRTTPLGHQGLILSGAG